MKQMSWLRWPLEHYSISLLIILILFVMGIYGMYVMPKDEFPHATIRQGVVVAVYPGATTEEVEQQVARPLERYLFTYGEVNRAKTTTTSQNGLCIVMVKLNDNVNNKDEVWSKIKHGLNTFKSSLPAGVLAVVVNDDFGNTSALLIAVESGQRSYRELKDYSDRLSDRLRRIPSVAIMYMMGIELNIVTLAALIVVLGMIVDNAIVVIDGYLEYLGKGLAPKDAAIESSRQYFMPMMLATLCICAIFYPFLLTMKGMFHDALEDFPVTITINLMVSLLLAVTVIPFLEVKLIKAPPSPPEGGTIDEASNSKTIEAPSGAVGGGLWQRHHPLGAAHLRPRA